MSSDNAVANGVRAVSAVPGRIRLRVVDVSAGRSLDSIGEELRSVSRVTSVDVRAGSSSIVVRFDAEHAAAVADGMASLGVDLRVEDRAVRVDPAATVRSAAADANGAIAARLDGTDLRLLVPLGLGMLAARQATRGEDRLADAPWYVIAWYASEMFWKFHGGPRKDARRDNEGE